MTGSKIAFMIGIEHLAEITAAWNQNKQHTDKHDSHKME
jgi:hypothetical protein